MTVPSSRTAGFSLTESLIALTLFLFLILAGIEVFSSARETLSKLGESQLAEETVSAAIDRIRADVRTAGRGLAGPGAEPVKSLEAVGAALVVRMGELSARLAADAAAGTSILAVAGAEDFPAGRKILVMDESKGESALVAESGMGFLRLAAPVAGAYGRPGTSVVLIREISLYMDAARSILRRKVEGGSGQPLLEDARMFAFSIGSPSPVVDISIGSRLGRGETHATSVHARNAALAAHR